MGIVVFTYDTVPIVKAFSQRQKISIPVLADEKSVAIRAFGVLNTSVPAGHMWAGVPYPGTFIVDANGIVKSKYFEDRYQDRYSTPAILLKEFGSVAGTRDTVVKNDYLELHYYATSDVARPDLRLTLVGDFSLGPKMHVYTPEVKGYIPIKWELEPSANYVAKDVVYPKGKMLMLPAIKEIVPVYEDKFRLTQDIVLASETILKPILDGDKILKVRGKLRYQACDDKICYLPQTAPLEFVFKLEPLDRQRVEDNIQHKAAPQN